MTMTSAFPPPPPQAPEAVEQHGYWILESITGPSCWGWPARPRDWRFGIRSSKIDSLLPSRFDRPLQLKKKMFILNSRTKGTTVILGSVSQLVLWPVTPQQNSNRTTHLQVHHACTSSGPLLELLAFMVEWTPPSAMLRFIRATDIVVFITS